MRHTVCMAEEHAGYQLAHPVYLDVAMMISFLAYLEGGVVTHEEATQKEAGARERLLKGRAGLRARLPWPLTLRLVRKEALNVGMKFHLNRRVLDSTLLRACLICSMDI